MFEGLNSEGAESEVANVVEEDKGLLAYLKTVVSLRGIASWDSNTIVDNC